MEDKDGKITFAATGETLYWQEHWLKTQNAHDFPYKRNVKFNGAFSPEFSKKIHDMIKLIEASEKSGPISTDKENER